MSTKRMVYFDILNILACVCVLGMHCNGLVHFFEDSAVWKESLVVEVLAYWAVPVFFMLSGATMMNYRTRYTTREFFRRRILRVAVPFVIWTVFLGIVKYGTGRLPWTGMRDFASTLLNFNIQSVYWFFGPLFMVYLSMPILSKIAEDKRLVVYTLGIGILTWSVAPFLCEWLHIRYNGDLYFPMTAGYIIFPLLGYYLHTTEQKGWQRALIYVGGIAGIAVRFGRTYFDSLQAGALMKQTWGYVNLPSLLLAAAIFVFIKYISKRQVFQRPKVQRIFAWMSGASFGIYLIHMTVINTLVGLFTIDVSGRFWRWLGPVIVYVLALVIVKCIQKLPFGKYLVP